MRLTVESNFLPIKLTPMLLINTRVSHFQLLHEVKLFTHESSMLSADLIFHLHTSFSQQQDKMEALEALNDSSRRDESKLHVLPPGCRGRSHDLDWRKYAQTRYGRLLALALEANTHTIYS